MHLELISNPDTTRIGAYKIARVIYAQTGATSLPLVEAMASMIANIATRSGRDIDDIISDADIFDCVNPKSPRHELLQIDAANRGFQMCLRVAGRMLRGGLRDACNGATRFHPANEMPEWATARGYIADVDGFLFYV